MKGRIDIALMASGLLAVGIVAGVIQGVATGNPDQEMIYRIRSQKSAQAMFADNRAPTPPPESTPPPATSHAHRILRPIWPPQEKMIMAAFEKEQSENVNR